MQWEDDEIHWFSIVNSAVILLFLSGMVALIMLRILRKDLYRSLPPQTRNLNPKPETLLNPETLNPKP